MTQQAHDIHNYNLLTENKWYLSIPFAQISDTTGVDQVVLNVTNVSIPELLIEGADVGFQGTHFQLPKGVRSETKKIRVKYLMSSDMHQYKVLYKWTSLIANENGTSTNPLVTKYNLNPTLFFLSEFKNPIIKMNYTGAWINSLGALELTYKTANEIEHSFEMTYAYMKFDENVK